MEPDHTPNEFPFSSAPGTELLQVPLSYRTSSDGRQLVYTITTCGGGGGSSSGGGGNGSGSGGGSLTPAMLADTAGLLDVLKQDTLVAVDALDGFAAHADQVACR
ncbi:dachshund homolog 1-like [Pollicipes pollicipes]|uniref:dachshund homolog 1-like n=1 Tax=Pollicipes pollicipes TaxID=41117 RepID=UPI001884E294|nr:dachshund homolog 1-like [Pollicipes pollicipes]